MKQRLLITNCRLLDADKESGDTAIAVENGNITQIGQIDAAGFDNVLDAQGRLVPQERKPLATLQTPDHSSKAARPMIARRASL